jgi:hypothetical protein
VDGSLERSLEHMPALAEAGITIARIGLRRIARDPSEIPGVIEALAKYAR